MSFITPGYDPSPLRPKILIYDLNGNLRYTYDAFESTEGDFDEGNFDVTDFDVGETTIKDFYLRSYDVSLGIGTNYGSASLLIDDPNNTLTDTSKSRRPPRIGRQWDIQIYFGKSQATVNRWFYGKIYDVEVLRPNTRFQQIRLTAVGWGVRLKERQTNIKRFQAKDTDGLTLLTSDTTTRTSELVKDIIQDTDHLPLLGLGTESGITVTGVDTIDVKLADLQTDFESFAAVIDYLAGASNVVYGVDADRDLYFRDGSSSDSGFLFTNDLDSTNADSQNWDADKIGYLRKSITGYNDSTFDGGYSVLHGYGALTDTLDVNVTTTNATYVDHETYYIAIPFTPTKDNVSKIALKMSKTGTPPADLSLQIVGGNTTPEPEETDLRINFRMPKAKVQALSGSGTMTEIALPQITPLTPSTQMYLIVNKYGSSGNEVNLDYQTGTGTYFRSTNGTTWTSQTGRFAIRTYHSKSVNITLENTTAKNKFGIREKPFAFRNPVNYNTAATALINASDFLGKEKRIYSNVEVSPITDRLPLGKTCRVYDKFNGMDIKAIITGVSLKGTATDSTNVGSDRLVLQLQDFSY